MRAVHSLAGGAVLPIAVKIISYLLEPFYVEGSKNICEKSSAGFSDFQAFAESVKNLDQNRNPKA